MALTYIFCKTPSYLTPYVVIRKGNVYYHPAGGSTPLPWTEQEEQLEVLFKSESFLEFFEKLCVACEVFKLRWDEILALSL